MRDGVILLVEDNRSDEELMLRALKKNNIRNAVVIARDGEQAIDYLFATGPHADRDAADAPAVILLDLQLPKIDGLDVLERIRSGDRTRLLPVVVLTSSPEDQDRITDSMSGANSFVRKPIEFTEFTEAVRELGLHWLLLNESPPLPTV